MIKYNTKNINDWNFGGDNITKVYRDGDVVYQKVSSGSTPSRLPSGYTEVEYVEKTSDTNAYQASAWTVPNDGVSGNVYTVVLVMNSNQINLSGYIAMFGFTGGYVQRQDSGFGYNTNCGYYSWCDYTRGNFTMVYDTKLVYKFELRKLTITNSSTSASTVINLNTSRSNYVNDSKFGVFSYNMNDSGAYMMKCKVYHILIQGSDSTVKHEYIPCKRDSDSKVGLYDIVGDNFYYPTAYTVTAGPEV